VNTETVYSARREADLVMTSTGKVEASTGYKGTGGPKRLLPWSSQVIEYTVSQRESFAGPQTTHS